MRYAATNEKRIAQLHPTVADKARQWLAQCGGEGLDLIVVQGLRTTAEQAALYAQGRSKPGQIVTNAKGGQSYHNYGLALDYCTVTKDGSLDWTVGPKWRRAAAIAKSLGFAWGGEWQGFVDYPHLEYTFGLSITALLTGKRPEVVVASAPGPTNKGEEPMTVAEAKAFEQLQATVQAQAAHIEQLGKLQDMEAPDWAQEAYAHYGPYIADKTGSWDFWRMLTIQYRVEMGLKQ